MTGGCSRAFRWHRDQTSPDAGKPLNSASASNATKVYLPA
jgi:hypothetical protein